MAEAERSDDEVALLATERVLDGVHSSLDGLIRRLDNATSVSRLQLDTDEVRDLLGTARTMSRAVRGMRARTRTQRQQEQARRRAAD